MSKINVNTVEPEGATTTLVLGASGDTVDIPSGATLDINGAADFTGATISGLDTGTANKPYFFAKTTADSTWGAASYTQMVLNSVVAESNTGSFSTTNYDFTVPSGEGGVYLIGMHLYIPNTLAAGYMKIQLNGADTTATPSEYYHSSLYASSTRLQSNLLMELSAGDVIDWWLYGNIGVTNGGNWVWGWRIW